MDTRRQAGTSNPGEPGFDRGLYPYELSLTLSGAIWSLRGKLDAGRANRLFYNALADVPDPSAFETVARRMFKSADDTQEANKIEFEFAGRGIGVDNPPRDPDVACQSSGNPRITWTDVSSVEAGYEIERKIGDGDWQLVTRLGADVTEHSDTGASCGGNSQTRYSYRVTAFSTYGSANTDTLRTVSVPALYPKTSRSQLRAAKLVVPEELQSEEPEALDTELHAVYPNPFNPVATISYALKEEDHISVVVYNVLGQRVAVLVDGIQSVGAHTVAFNASRLPSGTYFVRMETADYRRNHTILLTK